ncbi:hypothetical protein BDR26DRAFT_853692 [Obelidium mucronatum]|nr:hypothetical protein BDR26DRAFT_853692 [Obelidium mucronatum]
MKNGLWEATLLIMAPLGTRPQRMQMSTGSVSDPVLLDSFGARSFFRYDLSLPLLDQSQKVSYAVDVAGKTFQYSFHVPAASENSHVAFYSCNGFDCDQEHPENFGGVSPLWKDLLRHHAEKPFHVQIGGGDQLYMDGTVNIFDLPTLKQFLQTEDIEERRSVLWTIQHEREVSACYFRAYTSHFQTEAMRDALACIPYTFTCDDHDIFDGFGSYPESQRTSHVHRNIGRIAYRFYLLFNTTPHSPWPPKTASSQKTKLGPSTLSIAFDVRSQRTEKQVVPEECWTAIFHELNKRLQETPTKIKAYSLDDVQDGFRGLVRNFMSLVAFFRRAITGQKHDTAVENKVEQVILSGVGHSSVADQLLGHFGQPELRDDLIDEWTHPFHLQERNAMIQQLQNIARQHQTRVTFTSGDVHICGMGRFRTEIEGNDFSDLYGNDIVTDHRAMYQIISSAIGNAPGPEEVIAFLHTNSRILSPSTSELENTVEEMFELFQHDVDYTEKTHKRLMGRRNWSSVKYNPLDDSLNAELHVENVNYEQPSVSYGLRIPKLTVV